MGLKTGLLSNGNRRPVADVSSQVRRGMFNPASEDKSSTFPLVDSRREARTRMKSVTLGA
eukprot:4120792-Pyramimonas_sp.AAC.1